MQAGAPRDLLDRPASAFVARFVGEAAVVEATVDGESEGGGLRVRLGDGTTLVAAPPPGPRPAAGAPAGLVLRPADLRLAAGGDGIPARVLSVEDLGRRRRYRLALGGGREVVADEPDAAREAHAPGDDVRVVTAVRPPLVGAPGDEDDA